MATKVIQTNINPTPKLSAATIAAAAVSVTGLLMRNLLPEWYDADVQAAVLPIVVFLVGYLVHDDANIVVNTDA